jgi:hypothetical protein
MQPVQTKNSMQSYLCLIMVCTVCSLSSQYIFWNIPNMMNDYVKVEQKSLPSWGNTFSCFQKEKKHCSFFKVGNQACQSITKLTQLELPLSWCEYPRIPLCQKLFLSQGPCDFELWLSDLKINRGHLLITTNLHAKFEDCGPKESQVIGWTSFLKSRPLWPWPLTQWPQNQ